MLDSGRRLAHRSLHFLLQRRRHLLRHLRVQVAGAMLRLELLADEDARIAGRVDMIEADAVVGINQTTIAVSRQLYRDIVTEALIVANALNTAVIIFTRDDDGSRVIALLLDLHYFLEATRPMLMLLPHIDSDKLYFFVHVFIFEELHPDELVLADIGRVIDEQDASRNIVDPQVVEQLLDVLAAQLLHMLAFEDVLLTRTGRHDEVGNRVKLRVALWHEPDSLLRAAALVAAWAPRVKGQQAALAEYVKRITTEALKLVAGREISPDLSGLFLPYLRVGRHGQIITGHRIIFQDLKGRLLRAVDRRHDYLGAGGAEVILPEGPLLRPLLDGHDNISLG